MTRAIIALVLTIPLAAFAQDTPPVLLHGCESTEGAKLADGASHPDAKLEVNGDAAYLSEGQGSLHLSATSPADATGNSYLSVELTIAPTDMSKQALIFDAWSSQAENSRALYVRGYDQKGACALSWATWSSPVTVAKTTVDLYPGRSAKGLGWETDVAGEGDRTAVVKLRIYTGTHDPGKPFDLYLDNIRIQYRDLRSFMDITQPKKLYPETTLVQAGEPKAIIVTPAGAGWAAVAQELAAAVKQATGADLPVRPAGEVTDEQLQAQSAVLLGSIANNRSLLHAYSHHLCFADGGYPGDGGYELRTVHDPWGNGSNLICLGASDADGAKAALEALKGHIAQGETLVLPSLLEVKLSEKVADT